LLGFLGKWGIQSFILTYIQDVLPFAKATSKTGTGNSIMYNDTFVFAAKKYE
jgi:hypothetical protein